MIKCIMCAVLLGVAGFLGGHMLGQASERSVIANECRYSGHFSNKRTGFVCGVIKREAAE
jgi:hypothetical protein